MGNYGRFQQENTGKIGNIYKKIMTGIRNNYETMHEFYLTRQKVKWYNTCKFYSEFCPHGGGLSFHDKQKSSKKEKYP